MIGFMIGLTGEGGNAVLASTMAFGTLCTARLVHGFNCKSDYPVIFSKRFLEQYLSDRSIPAWSGIDHLCNDDSGTG